MIEVSAAWCSHVSLFFLPPSADVCLSVQVYRRITLRKHWAFALNREHRYSQLMFSLSGATPANHTLYWKVTGKATGHSFIMTRPPLCPCACSCYNGPKLNVTLSLVSYHLSHAFWKFTEGRPIQTSTCATAAGWGSDLTRCELVPNI